MGLSVQTLVDALRAEPQDMWVRVAAQWLVDGEVSGAEPEMVGDRVADALVAAATAQRARQLGVTPPRWTDAPNRVLDVIWHPGPPQFFGWSLAHAPAEFSARGLVIEADSLISV